MDFKSLFRFFLHCQEKIRLSTFPDEETKYCIVSFKESNSTKKQDALLSLFCFFPVNVVFFLLSDFLFQLHRQHLPLMPEISNRKPYIQSMHVFFCLLLRPIHPQTKTSQHLLSWHFFFLLLPYLSPFPSDYTANVRLVSFLYQKQNSQSQKTSQIDVLNWLEKK